MYKRLPVSKLMGDEKFKNSGSKEFSVLQFWQYGFSNLNSNVLRGALAEFIVENALKQNSDIDVRNPWGDSDVLHEEKKIEVKCCAYIQDWDQNQFTRIVWTGLKAKVLYWSSAVNGDDTNNIADYKSDIYVLSLFKHQDHDTLDILDMNQWCFWVLPKDKLKEISTNGNSISLSRLQKFNIEPLSFGDLAEAIKINNNLTQK